VAEEQSNNSLLNDSQWSVIDSEICRVIDFTPLSGSVRDGKVSSVDKTTPFASVTLECKKLPTKTTGFITHKDDFFHLWSAFKERRVNQDEEVLIIWTKKQYKNIIYRALSASMPKLWVMICPKNAFEIAVNTDYRADLPGEARWKARAPIDDWKPEVMK